MARLVSVRNRSGWSWPGFRAGAHTLKLDSDLKDWQVYVRSSRVFFRKGKTVHDESRDVIACSWELDAGESVDSLQKWDPPEPAEEKKAAVKK